MASVEYAEVESLVTASIEDMTTKVSDQVEFLENKLVDHIDGLNITEEYTLTGTVLFEAEFEFTGGGGYDVPISIITANANADAEGGAFPGEEDGSNVVDSITSTKTITRQFRIKDTVDSSFLINSAYSIPLVVPRVWTEISTDNISFQDDGTLSTGEFGIGFLNHSSSNIGNGTLVYRIVEELV